MKAHATDDPNLIGSQKYCHASSKKGLASLDPMPNSKIQVSEEVIICPKQEIEHISGPVPLVSSKRDYNKSAIKIKRRENKIEFYSIKLPAREGPYSCKSNPSKLRKLIDELHKDPALLRTILKFQVDNNIQPARELYEKRDIAWFYVTSVLFDWRVSNTFALGSCITSGTLSSTLLPQVNRVSNFNLLTQESHFIFGRFLNAMLLHHKDINESLGQGIILLVLNLNPKGLRNMWGLAKNITSLKDALSNFGIPLSVSMITSFASEKIFQLRAPPSEERRSPHAKPRGPACNSYAHHGVVALHCHSRV